MKKYIAFSAILAIVFTGCKTDKNTEKSSSDELSDSVRHHEWIDLQRADSTICKAFVVYPESDSPTKSVIVIHENRGLNDWAREFADQLAEKGFLVIAPDLISNTVDGVEKTTDFENTDKAREAIYALDGDQVTADLNAAYNYIKNDKASTGDVSVAGFCWGGSQTFRYATNNAQIKEALVFYGTAPKDSTVYARIKAPVYGFYGGNDNRVNSTIPDTERFMKSNDKFYEHVIYEGAGHAFMRRGSQLDSDEANKMAHDQAWEKLLAILNNE
ncbi:MAG: dienelactone hydrolase family protein [Flavobacteriaceae bacterium]|nr:dienelactone hydrolase family protein [Flavobacteriaceae bacterium]